MNVLYIAFSDFSNLYFGANKKVISQCKALEKLGNTVTLMGRYRSDIAKISTDGSVEPVRKYQTSGVDLLNKVLNKKRLSSAIRKYVQDKHFSLCYIRYDLSTPDFLKTVKALKRVCDKIVIEIATYPYQKEYANAQFSGIRLWMDDYYGRKLKDYVDYMISFYEVEGGRIFDIPVIQVPNGFDFSNSKVITDPTVPKDIHIAAVSTMREWHGYERFIEGMYQYYANGGERNIILHLVGTGPEYTKYMTLVEKYALQEKVIFHGAMHGDELGKLLERCTIGVDSLARHRSGISVLSSLKSREYGGVGIPLINSCKIDIMEDDYPYCLYTLADESAIPMEDVIAFHDRVYAGNNRAEVAAQIRSYIEERSDMNAVMKKVMDRVV
ncbi:MAG: hypothetical protein IKK11_06500 [Oscillospiraceae bacterium]|nr:hypothetical protein [Oscillospiraceae bacterium]